MPKLKALYLKGYHAPGVYFRHPILLGLFLMAGEYGMAWFVGKEAIGVTGFFAGAVLAQWGLNYLMPDADACGNPVMAESKAEKETA